MIAKFQASETHGIVRPEQGAVTAMVTNKEVFEFTVCCLREIRKMSKLSLLNLLNHKFCES